MERHNGIEPDPEGAFVYYADAQATVEALRRERDLYKHSSDTFAECVDNIREAMGLETTHYLVLPDDVGDMRKERDQLKLALDAEREKAKNDATAYRKLSEQWNATDLELSQLKALVRAFFTSEDKWVVAYRELERLGYTLDATTPAVCPDCDGDGAVDSGGTDPNGNPLMRRCGCREKGGDGE